MGSSASGGRRASIKQRRFPPISSSPTSDSTCSGCRVLIELAQRVPLGTRYPVWYRAPAHRSRRGKPVSQSSRLQRLLIATDLSIRAEHAFNRADQLALQNNAKLTVLHVIPDELEPTFSEALKEQARKALESLVAQAIAKGELQVEIAIKGGLDREQIMKQVAQAAAHGETSVEVRIEPGSVYDIINETAAAIGADLVICGVHHKLIIGDEWLGSTIDRVLRFGNRPVLVVKTPAEKAYEKILVGTDFSDQAAEALRFAFAAFPSANFILVNAFESSLPGFLKGAEASSQAID